MQPGYQFLFDVLLLIFSTSYIIGVSGLAVCLAAEIPGRFERLDSAKFIFFKLIVVGGFGLVVLATCLEKLFEML